ncbi:MAG: SGNH/GDSL hydrolase family protein [Clostridia bacterium]|nr:SGNH/GDSL hydrolase family protein [Clostridia bacterium]
MKLKKIFLVLLAFCMLSTSMAVSVSAADEATLEEIMLPSDVFNARRWVERTKSTVYYEDMEGLRVNLCGDSYLKGNNMANAEDLIWPALLSYKYGWELNNYAQNGAPVATNVQLSYRADSLVKIVQDMPANDPDVVIFDGGRNDWNNEVPIGTDDSTDTTTFKGALNTIIDTLKEKYPNAVLIYTTVWNFDGENDAGRNYAAYAASAEKVCNDKGVYVFKAYNPSISGVNMSSETFRSLYCLKPTDRSHLNAEGMMLVAPKYEAFIEEVLAASVEDGDTDGATNNGNDAPTGDNTNGDTDNNNGNGTVEPDTTPINPAESETDSSEAVPNDGGNDGESGNGAGWIIAIVAVVAIVAAAALTFFFIKKKNK